MPFIGRPPCEALQSEKGFAVLLCCRLSRGARCPNVARPGLPGSASMTHLEAKRDPSSVGCRLRPGLGSTRCATCAISLWHWLVPLRRTGSPCRQGVARKGILKQQQRRQWEDAAWAAGGAHPVGPRQGDPPAQGVGQRGVAACKVAGGDGVRMDRDERDPPQQ